MCRLCFHIHLLKVEGFPVLNLNLSLLHVPVSMIRDITTTLEPIMVQYATPTPTQSAQFQSPLFVVQEETETNSTQWLRNPTAN